MVARQPTSSTDNGTLLAFLGFREPHLVSRPPAAQIPPRSRGDASGDNPSVTSRGSEVNRRHSVIALRWTLFVVVVYVLLIAPDPMDGYRLALIGALGASNVGLTLARPSHWRLKGVLTGLVLLDVGVLTAALYWSGDAGSDLYLAYFLVIGVAALGGTLRSAAAGLAVVLATYWGLLLLQEGPALWRKEELLIRLPFLFVVGVLNSVLAEEVRGQQRELALERAVGRWTDTLSAMFVNDLAPRELLRKMVEDLHSLVAGSVRVSLVLLDAAGTSVVVSSDDPKVDRVSLDVERYPELLEAARIDEPTVIEDLATHPLTASLGDQVAKLPFSSLLICPVASGGDPRAYAMLRVARRDGGFSVRERELMARLAEVVGIVLHQEETRAQIEAAGRMQLLAQMAAGVAHDFNNVLTTILMSARIMQQECEPVIRAEGGREEVVRSMEHLVEALETIDRATTDGVAIVGRLSTWSRLQGKQTADDRTLEQRESLDPCALLKDAWRLVAPRHAQAPAGDGIEVRWRVDDAPRVRGVAVEIREALHNLLNNAIDAMPQGGTLTLGVQRHAKGLAFCVEDTGHGIPRQIQEKIFNPFFTTKGTKGTGLGLPLVRAVAERHGGLLEVASRVGTGSCFKLVLPAAQEATPEGESTPGTAAPDSDRETPLHLRAVS